MLKRMSIKKLLVCSLALFSLGILYLLPNERLDSQQQIEYVNNEINTSTVFLKNKNNYLTRVNIETENTEIEKKARELIQDLIIDDDNDKIPNGFTAVIPNNTKINSIKYNKGVIKIDFSDDLMDTTSDNEEKIIESIVYTLTNIPDIEHVIIYIDGEILSQLPKSKINLPTSLDRSFGINKQYNINSDKNITKTTVYYISTYKDKEYYIPVTKVTNDTRDKIEIIVEELSNNSYNKNLMSYLNSNTKLVSSNLDNDNLSLVFNEYILDNTDTQDILSEIIDTICLSIEDNYNVNSVSFNVNNKEINKTNLKSLE